MIYIIGAGYMAREYAKVLQSLNTPFLVIGRGEKSVDLLKAELEIEAVAGGLTQQIENGLTVSEYAIVCTPIDTLSDVTIELLAFGVKKILLEKPGSLDVEGLRVIKEYATEAEAQVHIGYNRRFYQATIALEERLNEEELIAANFEMTEWSHLIVNEPCSDVVKQKWVLGNTSHVIDLVNYIAGPFKELASFSSGTLPWHETAARFVGSGISETGVLISYCGYWDGPGRWSAEFVTTESRYIFRPMEKLQVQKLGSVAVDFDECINYELDEKFKPGLYLQTSAFLKNDYTKLVSITEQIKAFDTYYAIANYK